MVGGIRAGRSRALANRRGEVGGLDRDADVRLSPTPAIPLVWLANRSTLLSLTFGALALALYVRWRDDKRRTWASATACAFGVAALTGEYAFCLIGYLIAFELCRRGETVRRRLVGVLPQ